MIGPALTREVAVSKVKEFGQPYGAGEVRRNACETARPPAIEAGGRCAMKEDQRRKSTRTRLRPALPLMSSRSSRLFE